MLRYALKRTLYSILIMLGVLIVTFVLFRMSAGDPTEILLGKNPKPQEIEEMRATLGVDKPMFWGKWRKTELYSSAQFLEERTAFPGISYEGETVGTFSGLSLQKGMKVLFSRNFDFRDGNLKILISSSDALQINGEKYIPGKGIISVALNDPPEILIIEAEEDNTVLASVEFFRPTDNPWDSQALSAVKELVSFSAAFPYVSFLNFGKTLQTHESIRGKLWNGIWPSLFLMIPIFLGELILGIVLAMISCVWRGRFIDKFIMILSVAGMSISYLALIILGQWFLAYYLGLFPVWGWGDPRHLALPVLIGIISGTGSGVRFYRTVFLNEINKEYLRTAVAKGCNPFFVYSKHLLKNALIPIITRASTVLPFLFTGSLLLESFFGIPGLGYEGINALNDADLQMLKALVILGAFLFIVINLITDLAYAWVDPRVRLKK